MKRDCPGCFAQIGVVDTVQVIDEQRDQGGLFWCECCGTFWRGDDLDEAELGETDESD
jgi:hypothetical protein